MKYYSVNQYLKDTYGRKLIKITIDGGFTCPNRDGTLDNRGCIFCLNGSTSPDFSIHNSDHKSLPIQRFQSITEQINLGKEKISHKNKNNYDNPSYIAYFQSFTGTYGNVTNLRKIYMEAAAHPDIAIISIATRPDCLSDDILCLLSELNSIKPVWIELGLQTIHEESAQFIRRGYSLNVYDKALEDCHAIGIPVITHMIIGLPGETPEQIYETARYIGHSSSWGIKLQLLHILEGTDLAQMYSDGLISTLSLEEYASIVANCIRELPKDMVIHRITGDGDKKYLIAPLWSANKKLVLNYLNKYLDNF